MAQSTIQSAPNSTGATFRSNVNTMLAALFSGSSGATAPTVTVAGQVWFDTATAPGVLKIRNSTNLGWISINATDFATLAEALAGTLTTKAINPDVLKKILDGVASAPRIVGAAHKRLADMPVLTVSAADSVNVGNLATQTTGTLTNTTSTFVTAFTWSILLGTGSMRFRARHAHSASDDSVLSLVKNGTEVYSVTGGFPASDRLFDLAVAPGDTVLWRHRRIAAGTSTISNIGVFANDGYVERPAYVSFLNRDTP